MEQAELRELESRCIQDETPQCIAACPLHVDAKTFCALMGQRRVDKAWTILAKTLPLPGVLARICDAPCKEACIRKDAGGAIEMGCLERFCAENAKAVAPPRPLPSRRKRVTVVGAGLTGLCAAWEMTRRGFDVTLYCQSFDCARAALSERGVSAELLDKEIASLVTMGAHLMPDTEISSDLVESLMEDCDAMFIDSDDVSSEVADFGQPDGLTLGTQRAGVFTCRRDESSPVFQAAAGRRAANSIERYTQGVSMVLKRELEGPYKSRLFTSLADVESAPPVSCEAGYSEVEAKNEAKRCIQCECMECVKVCEYLHHFKGYPKVYARQIYNNESIVMGTRQANTMINSCMMCGLCETVCPEDFDMGEVCLQARRTMIEKGTMPQSAHEFALRDMAFANGEKSALARHAPGVQASEYVFFPGCQLTASGPDSVEAAYADLRKRLSDVGLMLRCCGAPAHWAGREALMEEAMGELRETWQGLGSPKIIVACPTCLKTLRAGLPEAEIVSHWSILRALGPAECASKAGGIMAINDPCAARHNAMLQEDVRALLDGVGVEVVEPEFSGDRAKCCGYGGLLSEANPSLAESLAEKRALAAEEDFVTYCVMCRDMIAKTGKKALHLYDLLYPAETRGADRPSPGYSLRRENRARLKERLLTDLWHEEGGSAEPFEAIQVRFSDLAAENMEQRRILVSDVQKVLLHARDTGNMFVNKENGHLLSYVRPVVVTYWVEFEREGEAFLVHNVWSHRMHIMGGRK
ncbi:FAD-dependent oxidoreductase [Pseudodesulfovibrio cashew]|uniref:FAD-dependent oxidoreductase n=1 Tax=Pseudodesulfovibrio cashew TaxID=2678688 RepID=A0A6I6JF86_9BACT|nr:pyridine nucleotide-disulfide oxidoreductase/dicluster-binding protein [Pseudodesulfovibrio cashew]QGY41496.1 FAD-dependent oxidoreductase [Pseudodesulfovibrio cashew]